MNEFNFCYALQVIESVLSHEESCGVDTGSGGPMSDLRDLAGEIRMHIATLEADDRAMLENADCDSQ